MDSIPDIINGIIEHHGVKGQKWGVRRRGKQTATTAPSKATSAPATQPKPATHTSVQPATHKPPEAKPAGHTTDHTSVQDPHKVLKDRIQELKLIDEHNKLAYNVHNAELKRIVDQMNLQKQYQELTKKPPGIGKKFVNNLIDGASKEVGKVLITALIKGPLEAKLSKTGAKTATDAAKTVANAVNVKPSMSAKATKKAYKKTKKGTGNLPGFSMSAEDSLEFTHEESALGKSAVESILARSS